MSNDLEAILIAIAVITCTAAGVIKLAIIEYKGVREIIHSDKRADSGEVDDESKG
jgi:hypothetical protein